ncbi:hypothetical protein PS880_01457 [Pseudomonas fluorescens]|uniref:Uncharacterized protein n=1 Tax=Pseudomonas fluorescens TaxID=294 RepID=A0A5E7IH60_PSEFL|nr:hypothetical protein PS880_01457 [Pseudomonas fluorescens]
MMNSSWADQVALVSGAGSEVGIGMAIAHRLGAQGAKLIVTASSARINERVRGYAPPASKQRVDR